MTDYARQFEDADELAEYAVENAAFLASLDRKAEISRIALSPFPTQAAGRNDLKGA